MCELSDHLGSIQMIRTIPLNEFLDEEMDSELVMKFEMMGTTLRMMDVLMNV